MLYSLPVLFQVCREQFVALHDSPILDALAKEFEEKFGHLTYVKFCLCVHVCARVCLYSVCTHISVLNISDMKSTQKRSYLLVGRVLYNVHLETAYQEQVSIIIIKTSFSNNEISHFTGNFDIREVLKSVYFFS